MIRSEPVAYIIRFYKQESDDPFADYHASCTVVWENHEEVWIKALNGDITRRQIVELAQWLIGQGVKKAKASRVHGKKLPFSDDKGSHQEFALEKVLAKLARFAKTPKS